MKLKEILYGCDYDMRFQGINAFLEKEIRGIAYDSRKVEEGYIFVAIKGEKYDGHDFMDDAIRKGAAAVVAERETGEAEDFYILVGDARRALACISNNFYERPSESLKLIGITGTNGKTTTTYILKSVLASWGKNVGLIGTIRYIIKDTAYPAVHTTPESPEFQSLLRQMLLSGCSHVVSEVSSHALAQYRVDGSVFDTAVFTNLTRDHLDFHKSMEDYYRAKGRLFKELLGKQGTAVINLDDPYGKRLEADLRRLRPDLAIVTCGVETKADIIAGDVRFSSDGLRFKVSHLGSDYDVSSPLTGMPNVYNIISTIGASISLGAPWQVILKGIEKAEYVAGRFEKIDAGQNFLCIVDYAHTEDALERLILTARALLRNMPPRFPTAENRGTDDFPSAEDSLPRIITVFGCGGDRDRGKRPGMGAAATRLSDFVILTTDNPRSEDAINIIRDIESGAVKKNYLIEPDRGKAIIEAVGMAKAGDIVLIAGKGHEDYQEIEGVRRRFSDRDMAIESIKRRCGLQTSKCKTDE
jgi:UDP-N-acetylmuramoyl-L-alanyl-D-glutamate--2,6-diaminopimelate ligase